MYCDVHGTWYECSGVPTQFYLYVLMVSLVLLLVYVTTTFLTICWLVCPCMGTMAKWVPSPVLSKVAILSDFPRFMRNYSNQLEEAAAASGQGESSRSLAGQLLLTTSCLFSFL